MAEHFQHFEGISQGSSETKTTTCPDVLMQILSIAYYRSGQYTWQLALNAGEPPQTESDIPLPSIEACLQEAGNGLIEEDPYVQLWYRGFCMGTVRADCLPSEATEIAERIVAAYAGLRVRA